MNKKIHYFDSILIVQNLMSDFSATVTKIPCCICGTLIEPNNMNMCVDCLRDRTKFADNVPTTSSIIYCRSCGRYQTGKTTWSHMELDSPELLQLCIKRLSGMKDKRVKDAKFLFTEPHSRRIRISLTLEQDSINDSVLRQTIIPTFVVNLMQCPSCCENATPRDHWIAKVQLRQSAKSKRTIFWIEQQILSHNAHAGASTIQKKHDGIDFHFNDKAAASRFVNYLKTITPAQVVESSKIMGEDVQCGTVDLRFSYSVRIPPINRQDMIILPKFLVSSTGNKSHVAICRKMAKNIRLVDPLSGNNITVDAATYWKNPFDPALTTEHLRRFIVLSIDVIDGNYADVELTDEETYQDRILTKTHLGNVLVENELCLAYDLRVSVVSDKAEEVFKKYGIPEVIVVGRTKSETRRKRAWHVKELAPYDDDVHEEFEEFLDELEEDPELRQDIKIYKNPGEELDQESLLKPTDLIEDPNVDHKVVYMNDPYE